MSGPTTRSLLCPVTVGRAGPLGTIARFLGSGEEGSGAVPVPPVLLVSGEAGIGKSRLVSDARAMAQRTGRRTVVAACFEGDRALPYAFARDLLHALADMELLVQSALDQGEIADLGPLLPRVVRGVHAGAAPAREPAEERLRLAEALTGLLRSVAKVAPLLVVVEDLHWSDDAGLDLLLRLARRTEKAGDGRIRFLLTYRNDEVGPGLEHVLAELDRERLAHEISLSRLDPGETDAMLRAIFGLNRPVPADFLHTVVTLTEGNPFFIEEVLKTLSLRHDVVSPTGDWVGRPADLTLIPRSVRDAVRRRLEPLDPFARRVLMTAAMVGRRCDVDLLLDLTGASEAALLAALADLVAAQFVIEEGEDRFVFRHALTQQAVRGGLLERERRMLHRQIGEALERRWELDPDEPLPDGAPVSDLAEHFAAAAAWERALRYATAAGERAQAMDAPRAAREQFDRAIMARDRLGRSPDHALFQARGQTAETLGDFERAAADYSRARDLAKGAGDIRAEIATVLALGLLWSGRDYDRAGQYVTAALALARELGDPTLIARCLNRLGNWSLNREAPDDAVHYHQEALAAFDATGDAADVAATLDLLGIASLVGGDLEASVRAYNRAVRFWRERGDRRGLASSLIPTAVLGPSAHSDTLFPPLTANEAVGAGEEGLATAQAIGWRAGEAWALWALGGMALAGGGFYDRALTSTRSALALAEEIEHRQWQTAAECMLGKLLADLFAWEEARAHLTTALATAREIGSIYWIRSAAGFLAAAAVLNGDLPLARSVVDVHLTEATPRESLDGRTLWCAAAELVLAEGDPEGALAGVDRLVAAARGDRREAAPRLNLLRGAALRTLGRVEEAEGALRDAKAAAERSGALPLLWRVHRSLGDVLLAEGKTTEAERERVAGRALVAELAAMVPDDGLRDRFLAAALTTFSGAPARPATSRQRARDEAAGLTAREQAVVSLLTQGRTNREIGEALFVTEWTAATHVRNILAKLGLRSRTQVAAWGIEHGMSTPPIDAGGPRQTS